jgi:N6-L-threonylcarbamoyladenine synthase
VAARSHVEVMLPVVHEALDRAGVTWDDIDSVAVTAGPGLLGSLLIGTLTARSLALVHRKPLYAVNHVVAHTFANFLTSRSTGGTTGGDPVSARSKQSERGQNGVPEVTGPVSEPTFPLLGLSVSGGHSHLIWFESPLEYRLIGRTRDDAAGEAFDKVAKMMGLPYPGGPSIGKLAPSGNEHAFKLPTANLPGSLDFSFSGLKTAVLRELQAAVGGDFRTPSSELPGRLTDRQKADMAASFQRTVCETLAGRLRQAYDELHPASVVIAGGVAANGRLREEVSRQLPVPLTYAPIEYCTDNAAMIASLGYFMAEARQTTDPLSLHADPGLAV